ncbi:hypothetical protein WN944_029290 [Citrus x changshan-huyou]|uniref:Uncharacterized protein n=1 Tax=Citrus x changshan-huyou TaxID=2935761 RepID=A0AAP0LLG7_9ROSI
MQQRACFDVDHVNAVEVAVGIFDPLENVASQAQKGVQDITKQAFGRKTLEEIEGAQLQAPGDCDVGKLIHNPHKGLQIGKDRGIEVTDQKTPEKNGGEQACDQVKVVILRAIL